MERNVGTLDRVLRLILAALLVLAAFGTQIAGSGPLHWIALIMAVAMAVSAIFARCPAYLPFGIRTCRFR